MHFILFGFKCCGKTTYGKLLAERLDLPFIDTDQLIEAVFGKTCRQLCAEVGIEGFRQIEKRIILSLPLSSSHVIALGAGAILSAESMVYLLKISQLIYLRLDRQTLFMRMLNSPLPYYIDPHDPTTSFDTIYCQRIPLYEKIPAIRIDLEGKTPQNILWQLTDSAISSASQRGVNLMERQLALSSTAVQPGFI